MRPDSCADEAVCSRFIYKTDIKNACFARNRRFYRKKIDQIAVRFFREMSIAGDA